ncbi:MAG: RDD family protein [Peptococcaceae bacterium]|nr:RDD family protein [Peptococcaceae bacterium]
MMKTLRAAGFWTRFVAFLFDLLIIGMSSRIFFHLVWPSGLDTTALKSFILVNALFPGIWGSLYFVLMTKYGGQTLGKMIMGIRVVSKDGSPLNWTTTILREVVGRILAQLLGTYLGYLVCAFHPRKQGLTDIVGDTYVVYTNGEKGKAIEIPAQSAIN